MTWLIFTQAERDIHDQYIVEAKFNWNALHRDIIWVRDYEDVIKTILKDRDTSNALDHEYKTSLPKRCLSRDSQHRSWDGYNWTIV